MSPEEEKRLNRFLFPCIAHILYVIPCFMGMFILVFQAGNTAISILSAVTVVAAIPVSFFGISCLKKHSGRLIAVALAGAVIILHIICASYLGVRYIILSPALVLLVLFIIFSGVIDQK